jgi:hypothetical protein
VPRVTEDVIMTPKTTAALAVAGAALAAPAAAGAAEAIDPPSPLRAALRAPVAGHLTVAAQMRAERAANLQADLTPRAVRLARRVADARDRDFDAAEERRRLHGSSPDELRADIREHRRELREARRERAAAAAGQAVPAAAAVPAQLEAIAACESGGDPTANTGNGFYGKYQFVQSTWESVGGTGNPAAASEAEQDMRAAMLYAREGASPWPVCGR